MKNLTIRNLSKTYFDPYAGTNVNILTSNEDDCDPVTGIPRMSALPVAIHRQGVAALA